MAVQVPVNNPSITYVKYLTNYLVALQDGVHALGVEAGREVATHTPEAPAHVAETVLDEHVLVHPVADLGNEEKTDVA